MTRGVALLKERSEMARKEKPQKEESKKSADDYHVHSFYSTKPGHKYLRSEACNCSNGKDHSSYESP
jgi:hypothetical protein